MAHANVVGPNVVDPNVVDPDVVGPDVVGPDVVDPDVVDPNPRQTRHMPVSADKPLFIRYPNSLKGWILFDESNFSAQHQKKGLEMFIESGEETLDISIPHSLGGYFVATFNKTISRGEDDTEIVLYSYTPLYTPAVQMIYADPDYIAYINRTTTI